MRDLLLVMIVLVALPMAIVRPMVGLFLWIGFSYMNPHRLTYGFAYDLPWVQLVAIVTLVSLVLNSRQRQPVPWKPASVLLLLFLLWTAVTSITAVQEDVAWLEWRAFLKIQVLAFVTLMLVTDRIQLHWVLWAIVLSFGFWGFKGGLFTVLSGGSYHVFGPPGSFFRNNNDFALVMCMTLPLMRYMQLRASSDWLRRGLWVLMALTVVSIIGTYSRGGLLGLAAMSFMLALKSRHRVPLIAVGLVMGVAVLAFMPDKWTDRMATIDDYQEDASAVGRLESYRFATNVALSRPLLGGGFNVWASDAMWDRYGPPGAVHRAVHSIYFDVLGSHGFVGLGLYLALIAAAWNALRKTKKLARAGPKENFWMHDLAAMLQVSFVGYLVPGAFLTMTYFELFYQLLALAVIVQVLAERAARQAAREKVSEPEAAKPQRPRPAAPQLARSRHTRHGGLGDLPRW